MLDQHVPKVLGVILPWSDSDRIIACRFDIPAFYREARRVLKPDGTLAAFAYRLPEGAGLSEANKVFRDFSDFLLGPDMLEAHRIWSRDYRGVEPTANEFGVVERAETSFDHPSTLGNWVKRWHVLLCSLSCSVRSIFKIPSLAAGRIVPHHWRLQGLEAEAPKGRGSAAGFQGAAVGCSRHWGRESAHHCSLPRVHDTGKEPKAAVMSRLYFGFSFLQRTGKLGYQPYFFELHQ